MKKIRLRLKLFEERLREAIVNPGDQLTRGQKFMWLCIDLGRHARRELRDDSAPTMAAALTYRTIFGLVPMLVMAMIVFRAFGGFEGSKQGVTEIVYDFLELEDEIAEVTADRPPAQQDKEAEGDPQADPDQPAPPDAKPDGQAQPAEKKPAVKFSWFGTKIEPPPDPDAKTGKDPPPKQADPELEAKLAKQRANAEMRRQIDEMVSGLSEGATSIKIGGIGVVGLLVLIWAAIGLIVTTEKTFNTVFNAPAGRPWHIRIPIYWAIITLGPVLLWGSFYISVMFFNETQDVLLLGWVIGGIKQFTSLIVTWFLLFVLFKLLPNADVKVRPAMIGALLSALAWELLKLVLRWYIESAVISPTQARLYGSLALIPILLFWVYLTWLVIIAGLEVTYILQTLPANRVGRFEIERPEPVSRDPWLVIPVMSTVAQAFDKGKTLGIDDIASAVNAPAHVVKDICDALVKRGLMHRLSDKDGAWTLALAMPPGKIRIADLIASAPGENADVPGHELLVQLAKAQDKALADVTLEGQKRKKDSD